MLSPQNYRLARRSKLLTPMPFDNQQLYIHLMCAFLACICYCSGVSRFWRTSASEDWACTACSSPEMTFLGMSTEAVTAPSQACSIQEADSLASLGWWEHRAARFSEASSSPCGTLPVLKKTFSQLSLLAHHGMHDLPAPPSGRIWGLILAVATRVVDLLREVMIMIEKARTRDVQNQDLEIGES